MGIRVSSRRPFTAALAFVLALFGTALVLAPSALASGPTSLGVSGWQVYSNTTIYSNPDPLQIHGEPGEYAAAPAIPAQDAPGWVDCGPSSPLRSSYYAGTAPLCPNASTIGMAVGSILPGCWSGLNFSYFQALVSIPANTTISQFSVNMSGADDGARISLVNSSYPNGVTPPNGYIYQLTPQSTGNLADYVVAGEVNRVVITQVDDCAVGNNLHSAQISLNGAVVPLSETITVTPDDQTMTYGQADPVFTYTVSSTGADTLTSPPTCSVEAAHSDSGQYPITCSGGTVRAGDSIVYGSGTLTVNPAGQTVSFTSAAPSAATYGGATYTPTATTASGLAPTITVDASSAGVCTLSEGAVSFIGVGTCTLDANQAGNADFTPAEPVQQSFTVHPAPLTITADNQNRLYDTANPVLTATYSGLVNGDQSAVVAGVKLATTAVLGSDVGTYPVTVSGGSDSDYTITRVNGTMTVATMPTRLTITSSPTRAESAGLVTVSANLAEALGSGSPISGRTVTFTATPTGSGPAVTATDTTDATGTAAAQLPLGTGTYTLVASFSGDDNADYGPSTSSSQSIVAYAQTQFVIWGGNAGGVEAGTDYTFWGAQWAKQVTGGSYAANASFKGYAATVSADGKSWSTSPGGSSNPPGTVSTYIGVLVSTSIAKSGSRISGNSTQTVILKVDNPAAYGPVPGHPGTGVMVALAG